MKFFVDAQLPVKLNHWLVENGYNSKHVIELPEKEFTTDIDIINFAIKEDRIIISKDSDFFKYYIVNKKPDKILIISTGNITNRDLIIIFKQNFENIYTLFKEGNKVIELNNSSIIVHY